MEGRQRGSDRAAARVWACRHRDGLQRISCPRRAAALHQALALAAERSGASPAQGVEGVGRRDQSGRAKEPGGPAQWGRGRSPPRGAEGEVPPPTHS